jgi:hypothetical protein
MKKTTQKIAPSLPTLTCLYVETHVGDHRLATATGFTLVHGSQVYLLTARHVVTGRNNRTGKTLHPMGGLPDHLLVMHHSAVGLGRWHMIEQRLYDDNGKALWLEHPKLGDMVDAVAIPLSNVRGSVFRSFRLGSSPESEVVLAPGYVLFVVGFPFGFLYGGGFGVWTSGFVASEPGIDLDDEELGPLPAFLIDSRTRAGCSGAPVVLHKARNEQVLFKDGSLRSYAGGITKLCGLYSGRLREDADLGYVWSGDALLSIISGGAVSAERLG